MLLPVSRLPETVLPEVYNVYLIPHLDPEDFTITGHVDIQGSIFLLISNYTLEILNKLLNMSKIYFRNIDQFVRNKIVFLKILKNTLEISNNALSQTLIL